jgi:hypothetical protein
MRTFDVFNRLEFADWLAGDYPYLLLREAAAHAFNSNGELAIVIAHVACELVTQRAFTRCFQNKGIPELEEPVTDFFNGYNLANERIRKVYVALTGDDITKQPFWSAFKDSSAPRNQFAHEGLPVSQQQASEALEACTAFVRHLEKFVAHVTQ